MTGISNLCNTAVVGQTSPQQVEKNYQSNLYKVNFKADSDQFVRQDRKDQTKPAIIQNSNPQAQMMRMLEQEQKDQKKKNFWNKFAMIAGIGASLAIIASIFLRGNGAGLVKGEKQTLNNAIRNVDKEKTLEELVLPKELQKVTDDIKILFDRTDQLKRKGMKGNSAIMLYGEPGGGKNAYTYGLTKYIQKNNPGSELIMMDVLKFNSKWLGETENNILGFSEEIIKKANANPGKKFVVFMDEFDSISRKATGSGAENSEKFQNAFKTAFNKLLEVDNIQIIAATNRASKDAPLNQLLDEAILNRFAKKVHVPLPTNDQLKNAIVGHYKSLPKDVINPELIDVNNSTLDKITQYITNKDHHASFRDMNYILERARTISESEAKSRPITIDDLFKATQEHAESMNWKDFLK